MGRNIKMYMPIVDIDGVVHLAETDEAVEVDLSYENATPLMVDVMIFPVITLCDQPVDDMTSYLLDEETSFDCCEECTKVVNDAAS